MFPLVRETRTHLVSVCSKWNPESSSETKVRKFQIKVLIDEEVLWLEITVQNAMRVAVIKARS
jgi:hypothetical protein